MANQLFQVSVIIPVYNADTFIRKAVDSALFHKEVKEIILVEDGSSDNSLQVCKSLEANHSIVHLFQHPNGINKGAGASRNLGIAKATQEYVCFLDADDYFTDIRFGEENNIFTINKNADGVYGAIGAKYYDETGATAWERLGFDEKHIDTLHSEILPELLFEYLIRYRSPYMGEITILAITVKLKKLLQHGIQFNESLRLHQDTLFLWQCSYYLNLFTGEINKPLAIRGVHENNRYIHHKNLIDSRSKFYKGVIKWAAESNLEKKYQLFFKLQFYRINKSSYGFFKSLILLFQLFILDSHYRNEIIRYIAIKLSPKIIRHN